jgi:hypothetical protein
MTNEPITSPLTHNANGTNYCGDCKRIVILFDDDRHFCHETLQHAMDFDHCIEVLQDGTVRHRGEVRAPGLLNGELDSDDWVLLNGYSSQYLYAGPIMHPSEYIGGGLAMDILSILGVYVAIGAYSDCEESDDGDSDGGPDIDGWAIARRLPAAKDA